MSPANNEAMGRFFHGDQRPIDVRIREVKDGLTSKLQEMSIDELYDFKKNLETEGSVVRENAETFGGIEYYQGVLKDAIEKWSGHGI